MKKVLKRIEHQLLKLLTRHVSSVGPRTQASDLNLETRVELDGFMMPIILSLQEQKRLMQKYLTGG